MKYFMTEEEWIRAQEESEDNLIVKEFREAMEKERKQERKRVEEKIEKMGRPYELPYVDLF